MDYGTTISTGLRFEEAVARIRRALSEQGFGVLTEIDVQQTLKSKLGVDLEPYLILGACNPELAHQALDVERDIGLLLPCNVVVRRVEDRTVIQALDLQVMVAVPRRTATRRRPRGSAAQDRTGGSRQQLIRRR